MLNTRFACFVLHGTVFFCGCLGLSSIVLGQENEYIIRGRAIDFVGKAADAEVRVVPIVKKFGLDILDFKEKTTEDGTFEVRTRAKIGQTQYLYLDSTLLGSVNRHSPLNSPFISMNSIDKRFVGIPIKFAKERKIDLGDTKVQFWYGDVNLRYLINGRQLTFDEWNNLWYTIRNADGKIVAGRGIDPKPEAKEVDLDRSELRFILPEGTWKVELQPFSDDTWKLTPKIVAKTGYFVVKRGKATETVKFIK